MASHSLQDFETTLAESTTAVLTTLDNVDDWNADRHRLLAELAEHEVMHEGQIIRHVYAIERELPTSWKWA